MTLVNVRRFISISRRFLFGSRGSDPP
jgi:hypothetical protein